MPFRARLHPLSIVRRQAAAQRFSHNHAVRAPVGSGSRPLAAAEHSGPPSWSRPSSSSSSSPAGPGPQTLHARSLHSGAVPRSAFGDLFRKSKPTTAPVPSLRDAPVNELMNLPPAASGTDILNAYELLAWALRDPAQDVRGLTADEAAAVLNRRALLWESPEGPSLRSALVVRSLYDDLEPLHGVTPDARHARAAILALSAQKTPNVALRIAKSLDAEMAAEVLGEREWLAIVGGAAGKEPEMVDLVLRSAREAGYADERVYAGLYPMRLSKKRRETHQALADVGALLERDGVTPGPWCEVRLVNMYHRSGDLVMAQSIVDGWTAETVADDTELRLARSNARALLAVSREDGESAELALRDGVSDEVVERAFATAVLTRLGNLYLDQTALNDAVYDVTTATGVDKPDNLWNAVIAAVKTRGGFEDAHDLYVAVREDMEFLDPKLALWFVREFCPIDAERIEVQSMENALDIYKHLPPLKDLNILTVKDLGTVLMLALLRCNVQVMPGSTGGAPETPVALQVAADLVGRGVVLDRLGADQVKEFMAATESHPEAFKVYRQLTPLLEKPLTPNDIEFIAGRFIAFQWPGSLTPAPSYVFQFMNDIRRMGGEPEGRILTALLNQYGVIARSIVRDKSLTPADRAFGLKAISSAVKDVQNLTNLDAQIVVNVPLLTALMGALAYSGNKNDALEVFKEVVPWRERLGPNPANAVIFQPSISVAIDACGFSYNVDRARQIWQWALRHKLPGKHNWETWVECLARCGRMHEALDEFNKMGKDGLPAPSQLTFKIMAYFAIQAENVYPEIKESLEKEFPKWWSELTPEEIAGTSERWESAFFRPKM